MIWGMSPQKPLPPLFRRMMEVFHESQWTSLLRSFFLQPREEKKARLHTVMALSVELHKIRQTNIFSTGLAEIALEYIIEGDWDGAAPYVEHFKFNDEPDYVRQQYAPLWDCFCNILQAAVADAKIRNAGGKAGN